MTGSELTKIQSGDVLCDSRVIAEKFEKSHDYVIKRIRKLDERLVRQKFGTKNNSIIKERIHKYRGREFPYFLLNRKAFTLLVMGFTGDKAFEWQERFYDAFSAMEKALLNQSSIEWKKQREQGKLIRSEETDAIQKFVEYAKSQGSKNAQWYYKHFTNATYKALQLIQHKQPNLRETLDMLELNQLLLAENVALRSIEENMKSGEHYKAIFANVKNDIEKFASTLFLPKLKT